jgi:beta-glucosidase
MEMPAGDYFGSQLGAAISAGIVSQVRLDDMVTRLLGALVRVGVFDDPPTGNPSSVVTSAEHDALAKEAATAGITLLRNNRAALPIDANVRSIAVLGSAGGDSPLSVGGGSAQVNTRFVVSPFTAIQEQAPSSVSVTYARGDGGNQDQAVAAAAAADAAVVFAAAGSSEGYDRDSLALSPDVDALITAVAAVNPRTIVVLHTPGAVLMPWLDRVGAVLVAWFPGEQNGNAIAPILLGTANPSGKLPVSFPRSASDLPPVSGEMAVPYSEGLAIGYRALDAHGITPLFPFGHGLSYTTFAYSDLTLRAGAAPGSIEVAFTLRNTGARAGSEVAQLYLGFPDVAGEPPRLLRGFEHVALAAGENRRVTITLGPRQLSCWNPIVHARYVPSGTFTIAVGGSSRDLPLQTSLQVVGFGPQY